MKKREVGKGAWPAPDSEQFVWEQWWGLACGLPLQTTVAG